MEPHTERRKSRQMTGSSPLILYPESTLVLPPAYCGSIRRYAAIAMHGASAVDTERRFNKRDKECHRCVIEGSNGIQRLTVPLEKPQEWHSTRLKDVRVSSHGKWWHVHWEAICSAYGRTPFFEYYADDIAPAFSGDIEMLVDLDDMIDRFCRSALGLPETLPVPGSDTSIVNRVENIRDIEYYQIWAERFGFTPGLSVLDLIFNMGPEAPLVLQAMTR